MKDDTLITIGVIGIGAYVAYKLMKPISETVGEVGGGLGTAVSGAGESVSDVLTGASSPFAYIDEYFQSKSNTQQAREKVLTDLYTYDKGTQAILSQQVQAKEQTKANLDTVGTVKSQSKLDIAHFKTDTTAQSLQANTAETVARKTEYGATVGQFLEKTFMPTKEVAQERRDAVVAPIKKVVTSVISLFTKKK
jgi:hypothetical protein